MPAKRTDSGQNPKRQSAPFKPPTRLDKPGAKSTASRGAAKSHGGASKDATTQAAAKKSAGKRSLATAPDTSLLESESGSDVDEEDEDMDDSAVQQTRRTSGVRNSTMGLETNEEQQPVMPEPLLTRLIYEGFDDKGMKVGKEAMKVIGKYVETFVREAVARAQLERTDEAGDGLGEGFLQVEDLEKLAPQLLLDF